MQLQHTHTHMHRTRTCMHSLFIAANYYYLNTCVQSLPVALSVELFEFTNFRLGLFKLTLNIKCDHEWDKTALKSKIATSDD